MSAIKVIIDGVTYRPLFGDKDWSRLTLPQIVRAHRNSAGWTLDEAAEQIGCCRSYLHSLEVGKCEPSLRMAYAISLAYGMSMERLALAQITTTKQKKTPAL